MSPGGAGLPRETAGTGRFLFPREPVRRPRGALRSTSFVNPSGRGEPPRRAERKRARRSTHAGKRPRSRRKKRNARRQGGRIRRQGADSGRVEPGPSCGSREKEGRHRILPPAEPRAGIGGSRRTREPLPVQGKEKRRHRCRLFSQMPGSALHVVEVVTQDVPVCDRPNVHGGIVIHVPLGTRRECVGLHLRDLHPRIKRNS
jgi:hypothetical protein